MTCIVFMFAARVLAALAIFPDLAGELWQAMRLTTEQREEILADFHLTMLRIAHPEFRFTTEPRLAGRLRWVAVRRNLTAGLHTVVTSDLNELLAVISPPDLSCKPADRDPVRCAATWRPPGSTDMSATNER